MGARRLMRMRGALLVGAVLMMTIGAGCGASPNKGNGNSAGGSTTQAPAAARDRTGSNQQTAQEGSGSGNGSAGADALIGPNGEKLTEAQILAKVCPDVKDTGDDAAAQGSGDAKNYGSVAKRFTQALAKKCEARDKP